MKVDLSPEELSFVDTFLEKLQHRIGQTMTLDEILHRWERFINLVKEGYTASIYEYTYDLANRDYLAELFDGNPALENKLGSLVLSNDNVFKQFSQPIEHPLATRLPERWWWWRIPIKLDGELASDLRARNIIK